MWRAVQRKFIHIREEDSLQLVSIGSFVKDEGYNSNLQLYQFVFKSHGVAPRHIYSPIPWSTIKALYLSAEVMIIEHFYPFLTLRQHTLNTSQHFVDLLECPPIGGIVNGFKRVIFGFVSLIPRLNDKAWEWIDRDTSQKVGKIMVLESDIPSEAIEYLYRVEYTEMVPDPEMEEYVRQFKKAQLNCDEIEDLETRPEVKVTKIEPLYAVLLKEEDETVERTSLIYPEELERMKRKEGIAIKKEEPAYDVDYLKISPRDTGKGIFPDIEVQQIKDDPNTEVVRSEPLKTVRYTIRPEKMEDRKKLPNEQTSVLPADEIEKMRDDAIYHIVSVTEGPQFVTYSFVEKKRRKEVNLTKREIDEMKLNPEITIINVDEIVQAKRVRSFRDNPEDAVSLHITYSNAIAVQKMRSRQVASEKEKIVSQLNKTQERLFEAEVESSRRSTARTAKSIDLFKRADLVLDKVLEDIFSNELSGMTPDRIKIIAHRDFQILMSQITGITSDEDIKKKISEVSQRITKVEQDQRVTRSREELERALQEQFPTPIEEE
jgi:hypothetical protein